MACDDKWGLIAIIIVIMIVGIWYLLKKELYRTIPSPGVASRKLSVVSLLRDQSQEEDKESAFFARYRT